MAPQTNTSLFGSTSRKSPILESSPEFFGDELPEKKLLFVGMSILTILLSLGPGCHTHPPLKIDALVDQPQARNVPS
jgi:hypothetical protein